MGISRLDKHVDDSSEDSRDPRAQCLHNMSQTVCLFWVCRRSWRVETTSPVVYGVSLRPLLILINSHVKHIKTCCGEGRNLVKLEGGFELFSSRFLRKFLNIFIQFSLFSFTKLPKKIDKLHCRLFMTFVQSATSLSSLFRCFCYSLCDSSYHVAHCCRTSTLTLLLHRIIRRCWGELQPLLPFKSRKSAQLTIILIRFCSSPRSSAILCSLSLP